MYIFEEKTDTLSAYELYLIDSINQGYSDFYDSYCEHEEIPVIRIELSEVSDNDY